MAAAAEAAAEEDRRALREVLYHVGRCVYLLDAVDDLEEDAAKDRYNPLRFRFPDGLTDEGRCRLRESFCLSQRRAVAAWQLLPESADSALVENILTIGLPQMFGLVLGGQWKNRRELLRNFAGEDRGGRA